MKTFAAAVVAVLLGLTFAMPSFAVDVAPVATSVSAPIAAAKSKVAIHSSKTMAKKHLKKGKKK